MLVCRAKKVLAELVVTQEMADNVEKHTRGQSKCAKWYAYHAGGINASVIKGVYSTSATKPSGSALKK